MKDSAPFINSEMPNYPKASGNARQQFPGSNSEQARPSLIKRDSDVCAPYIEPMGGANFSYAPAKNKKRDK